MTTSPVLLAQSSTVRAALLNEVLQAGGVVQWLQQCVAQQRPLSAAESLREAFVPGMPVDGQLQMGRPTVLSYLLKPMADQLARALKEE